MQSACSQPCRRRTAVIFKDTFSIHESAAVQEPPHTQSQHHCRREVMVYSITLADRPPCYDNLLNTKLNTLFALEDDGRFAECSPFPSWKAVCTFSSAKLKQRQMARQHRVTLATQKAAVLTCEGPADWLWKMKCHLTVSERSDDITLQLPWQTAEWKLYCSEY